MIEPRKTDCCVEKLPRPFVRELDKVMPLLDFPCISEIVHLILNESLIIFLWGWGEKAKSNLIYATLNFQHYLQGS